jgi:hypothetical protein
MPTNQNPAKSSTPSYEIALAAIMRADAVVWAERNNADDAEADEERRDKIRATLTGSKQSPEHIAKKVAACKAARAARSLVTGVRYGQAIQPTARTSSRQRVKTVSPVIAKIRRTSHG